MTTYINSIQHITVTIASGSSTGTATISSVDTSKTFLIFGGVTTTDGGSTSGGIGYVTLTNATTVTATRTGTAAITVTITVTVVEATSSLVSSVQYGTVSISATTTNTATISSVDTSRSAVFYLGFTGERIGTVVLTNSTTVTGTYGNNGTGVLSFVVVEFQSAAITSIQQKNQAFVSSSSTDTLTITSVDTSRTMLAYGGTHFSSSFTDLYAAEITSSTAISLYRGGTGTSTRTIALTAIQFASGVVSAIDSGVINLQNVTSNTDTVSLDKDVTAISFTGWRSAETGFAFNIHYQKVALTNDTTVTGTVNTSTNHAMGAGWQTVTFGTGSSGFQSAWARNSNQIIGVMQ